MKRPLMIVILFAMLATGCAAHTAPAPVDGRQVGSDDNLGATVANIWYVPGRGLLCGAAGILSGFVLFLTAGHNYDSASLLMHGACSGPWLVRPSDVRNAVP